MRTATYRLDALAHLRVEIDRLALFVATTLFTLAAVVFRAGELDLPGGWLLLIGFPVVLIAVHGLNPGGVLAPELRRGAAWACILLVALWAFPLVLAFPLFAVGLPVVVAAAALCARYPAGSMVFLLLITGGLGTFQAYLGFSPSLLIDLLLGALAVILAARIAIGRPYSFTLWPAILIFGLYVAITFADLLTAEEVNVAWLGFHATVVYMLAMPALAYLGWERRVYRRIVFGFVVVTTLVMGYAVLRWVVGPSGAERELATAIGTNVDPADGHLKTVGSFLTAHQLTLWAALMGPLCAGYMLWAKGRRRLLAAIAIALCLLAAFASEGRGPLVGLVAGLALVLGLYQVAQAFPGFKPGVIAVGLAAVLGVSGTVVALSTTDPEGLDRYTRILTPGEDPTYAQRVRKWEAVWADVEQHPLGQGLGSGGQAQRDASEYLNPTIGNLDNSYLKIAFEQGLAVAGLFAVGMLTLLGTLVAASIRTRSKEAAAIGIGASGTLVSLLVSMWAGLYVEATPVLAGWMVIGIGLSYFVAHRAEAPERGANDLADLESPVRARAAAVAARTRAQPSS